ncbi:MAG TPA: pyruvate formate lyase family protein [Terriglobia bacterium]|nr:pyruvate formate lyase family protein [Terriglobia bacterium]
MEQISYADRLAALRRSKQLQTLEKQQVRGAMDFDDHAIILPPPEMREIVQTLGGSGVYFTDVVMNTFKPVPNHPSGGFFGPRSTGENFRRLLEVHPVYIDPLSSLAGAYMVNFMSYRTIPWNPDIDCAELLAEHAKYQTIPAIGGVQHMCQDMEMGLKLGWGGVLDKIRRYRPLNPASQDFYAGLEHVVLGMQNLIRRHAEAARRMADDHEEMRSNLLEMAEINERLVTDPPRTFREACQWILWYQSVARMYNSSGSLGRLDVILLPYYEADLRAGRLTDEEAIFHIACHLVRDTAYIQLGGPDASGRDATNPVSFLILEAAHRLRIPANIGVCVGRNVDPRLVRRGVEILLEDRIGVPKFLGVDNTVAGFAANGFPLELARERVYAGCHWLAIPGREYALMDIVKINFAAIFEVALREMLQDAAAEPSVAELWRRFRQHLRAAVDTVARGFDFQYEHMHEVFPELVLDLLCQGTIEKGLDASNGGVEFYTFGVDGAALATAADSFAAVEERIEKQRRLSWGELRTYLESNWAGPEGERARVMMKNSPRFGSGGSLGDEWAVRIARAFSETVKEKPTPRGFMMIPGLFSWVLNLSMGKNVGATPNGRRAGDPISHGANPDPGFRKDGAPTALAVAVAAVQPGYGNASPLQIDLDPSLSSRGEDVDKVEALIRGHCELGGTQVNINILSKEQVLEAHKDPAKFPDLIVRVTGFSAYFASLSPEMRQFVVDRIVSEN